MTAKEVLQQYIKVPIDTISTNRETIYVSSALLAMEEYVDKQKEKNKWEKFENKQPVPNSHIMRKITPINAHPNDIFFQNPYYADFWEEGRIWKIDDEKKKKYIYEWKYVE